MIWNARGSEIGGIVCYLSQSIYCSGLKLNWEGKVKHKTSKSKVINKSEYSQEGNIPIEAIKYVIISLECIISVSSTHQHSCLFVKLFSCKPSIPGHLALNAWHTVYTSIRPSNELTVKCVLISSKALYLWSSALTFLFSPINGNLAYCIALRTQNMSQRAYPSRLMKRYPDICLDEYTGLPEVDIDVSWAHAQGRFEDARLSRYSDTQTPKRLWFD